MTRVIPGLLLAAGWLILLLKGSYLLFWGVVVLISLIGGREFIRMTFPDRLFAIDRVILAVIISIPVFASVFTQKSFLSLVFGVFIAFGALIGFMLYNYDKLRDPLHILKGGVFGIIFVGFLAAHLVLIHTLENGNHWLIILTAITAGSDSGAFWVGSRWGSRKLCPNISPKKTVEGALGGIAAGMAAGLILYSFLDVTAGLLTVLIMTFFLSIIGMIGDLLESMIKRGTSTKDSGTILAGHGGVLDRVDSLLLTAPSLYYFLYFLNI